MLATLLNQLIIMFILILTGALLFKFGFISRQGSGELGRLLITIIIPCVILKAYITECTPEKLYQLFLSFFLAVLSLIIAMLISYLIYRDKYRIENFSASFSNAAFIGIPLVQALLGTEAVFFMTAFIASLNLLQWTYGVVIMSGRKDAVKPKKIITNPILIGLTIGLILFAGGITLPDAVLTSITYIGNMNTPAAMIVLGVYLAQTNILSMFTDFKLYLCVFLRLLLIPLVTIGVFALIPIGEADIKTAILVAACTPVGSNAAIFAQQNNLDYTYACKAVCLSTIISIVTIPFIVWLASMCW